MWKIKVYYQNQKICSRVVRAKELVKYLKIYKDFTKFDKITVKAV